MIIALKSIILPLLLLSNHFDVVAPAASSTMDPLPPSLTQVDDDNYEVSNYFEYLTDNTESYYDDLVDEDLTTTNSQKASTTEEEKVEQAWAEEDSNDDMALRILRYCGIGGGTSFCIAMLCHCIYYCRKKRNASNNVIIPSAPKLELLIHTTEQIQISDAYKDKGKKFIDAKKTALLYNGYWRENIGIEVPTDLEKIFMKYLLEEIDKEIEIEIIFIDAKKTALLCDGYYRKNIGLQMPTKLKEIFMKYLLEEDKGYIAFHFLKGIFLWDHKPFIHHRKEYKTIQMRYLNGKISLNEKRKEKKELEKRIKSDLNKVREISEEYIAFAAGYWSRPIQDSPDIKSKNSPLFTETFYSLYDMLYYINFKGEKDEDTPYQEREARYENYDAALKDGWDPEDFTDIEESLRGYFSEITWFKRRFQEDEELQKILTQIMGNYPGCLPSTHLIGQGYPPILCHNKLVMD